MEYLNNILSFSILLGFLRIFLLDVLKPSYHEWTVKEQFSIFLYASLAWPYYITIWLLTLLSAAFTFLILFIKDPIDTVLQMYNVNNLDVLMAFAYFRTKKSTD